MDKWILFTLFNLLFSNQIFSVYSSEYLPVLIWTYRDVDKANIPALGYLSGDEFYEYLKKQYANKPLVFFSEENLSMEDFSWKDTKGLSSYENVKNIILNSGSLTFFPMVHKPQHFIKKLTTDSKWHYLDASEIEFNDIDIQNQTYIYIGLEDAQNDENRPNFLKRHDLLMAKIINKLLEENEDTVFVYSAKHSSWFSEDDIKSRPRRHLSNTDKSQFFNGSDEVFIYTVKPPVLKLEIEKSLENFEQLEINRTEDKLQFSINYPNNIILSFFFTGPKENHWNLYEVEVKSENKSYFMKTVGIEGALHFSYFCSKEVIFEDSNGNWLKFYNIQVQPFLTTSQFGNAYDSCGDYMTAPIWSGLFVTTIFIMIMALGIHMILDIKTMDRFDDPKGKSIPISVSE